MNDWKKGLTQQLEFIDKGVCTLLLLNINFNGLINFEYYYFNI